MLNESVLKDFIPSQQIHKYLSFLLECYLWITKTNLVSYKINFFRVFPNQSHTSRMRSKFHTVSSRGNLDRITMLWNIVAFLEALFFCIWQVFLFSLVGSKCYGTNKNERRTASNQICYSTVLLLVFSSSLTSNGILSLTLSLTLPMAM